jgi:hypothetical protein
MNYLYGLHFAKSIWFDHDLLKADEAILSQTNQEIKINQAAHHRSITSLNAPDNELTESLRLDLDLLLEADGHHGRFYLLHFGPREPVKQIFIQNTKFCRFQCKK